MVVEYVDEPFAVEISNGVAMLSWPDGARKVVPLAVFRANCATATAALAEFDAEHKILQLARH